MAVKADSSASCQPKRGEVASTHGKDRATPIPPRETGIRVSENHPAFLSPMPIKYSTGTRMSSSGLTYVSVYRAGHCCMIPNKRKGQHVSQPARKIFLDKCTIVWYIDIS